MEVSVDINVLLAWQLTNIHAYSESLKEISIMKIKLSS
jgi:hypothetical protein